ncbi:MAG: hypothetical protein Pg6C_04420 [Treponemataceae bacterium]|nr:MAG: hypothetical protein Pg6C_04420 [Treponemataceae bacterium]
MKHGVVFSVLVLTAGLAFAQSDQQPLATIKISKTPEVIKVLDVRKKVESYEKQTGRKLSTDERREVLDSLIDEKLVLQAARQAGLNITDADVNKYFIDNISQQMGRQVTEQQFAAIMKQQTGKTLDEYMSEQVGMNVAEYKNSLKNQLLAQQYIMQQKQQEIAKIAATDREVREFYDNNKASFARNDMLKLFLVISQKGTDAVASKTRISGVLSEVKANPGTCEAVAKRLSSDTQMRAGDILIERRPEYAQRLGISTENLGQLFSQNIGFVSDITETAGDFQFYMIRERFGAKMLKLDEEIEPGTTVTVYDYIRDNITAQKRQQYFAATAMREVVDTLRKPENYSFAKKEDEIKKLLSW